ncbi:MAG: LysM peptidoglycan-binding domain-containing protein [Bacteroidia bacterium]
MKQCVIFLLAMWVYMLPAQQIPAEVTYCGIKLKLTAEAQANLATYVAGIYESPRYYNAMVERAYTYMPFIEEALREQKAPLDLKYLAIQESSLKGDAVSSSNAVGYWQFKEPVAKDFDLQVTRQIDERRHIFRSSQAAGMYLKKANEDFDNYVYAVIAYYEGMTGAVQYTNPEFYGKREMIVDENLHWYVMKAIAHKIAYEQALNMEHTPKIWLEPAIVERGSSLADLSNKHGVEAGLILEYNPWILDERRLPSMTYYIPRFDAPYPGHTTDPLSTPAPPVANNSGGGSLPPGTVLDSVNTPEASVTPRPRPVVNYSGTAGPPAQPVEARPDNNYAKFKLTRDLHYGAEYVMVKPGDYLNTIADQNNISLLKLLFYNQLNASQMPEPGKILYLNKAKKVQYHIVEPYENISGIAARYGKSVKKLQKLNGMEKNDLVIYVGQKLHVKKKKTKGERLIVLQKDLPGSENPKPASNGGSSPFLEDEEVIEKPVSENPTPVTPVEEPTEDFEGPATEWVEHTVQPGETLWRISQAYGTKVEIIKLVNKLTTDSISPGTTLRILAKKDKLQEMNGGR